MALLLTYVILLFFNNGPLIGSKRGASAASHRPVSFMIRFSGDCLSVIVSLSRRFVAVSNILSVAAAANSGLFSVGFTIGSINAWDVGLFPVTGNSTSAPGASNRRSACGSFTRPLLLLLRLLD